MDSSGFLFLTGATGHTGCRVARRFLDAGRRLRCLNFNPDHARHLPTHERLEVVHGDLRRPNEWTGALAGAEALIHMAHIGFAEHVVAACESAQVERVIALSSTRRFTRFPDPTAQRVIEGERRLSASSLNYTILRSAMIYGGPRDHNLERVVAWLKRRRWMPLIAGGRQLVQPIFVLDLVDAVARARAHPETTARRALTVAGPEPMTWRCMIETIGKQMGRRVIWLPAPYGLMKLAAGATAWLPGRPGVTSDQVRRLREDRAFAITDAVEALGGWHPRSFEEGMRLKLAGQA